VKSRGAAVAIVFLIFLGVIVAAGALIIPTLVRQITGFIDAVPGYVDDITHGRGPLGFLETKYHVVEHVQKQVDESGGAKLFAHAGVLVSVGKGIVSFLTTSLTIITFTLFMLLEGPAWVERVLTALPEPRQTRLRALNKEIYRTVSGYVTGNILISLICAIVYGITLTILGVKFALALAVIAGILDLVPMVGATIAGVLMAGVALAHSVTAAVIIGIVVFVYQQLENHVLQPVVYGKTVQLSPLLVLIAVLVGATIGGIFGVLLAIPIAGTLQVVVHDVLDHRRKVLQT
jgi:predicted PurR-regulated permease PerM